ncbi:MAG: alpha/beta hydrolase-fold protein [Chloroflexota bacterium]|nr:alpha/beta hydrolase-fold protein [Chloroflexota bacterium]
MLQRYESVPSRYVLPRHVDVWCPPGYREEAENYPVIYMHDGQNLFDDSLAYGGVSWGIDHAMRRLIEAGTTRGAIVVGIWNSEIRWREYMPNKVYESPGFEKHRGEFLEAVGGEPVSDLYLRFLVEEVKPFIDSHFRALPDRANTFVTGSSMGGLISLYAVSEYPGVFGGAACISTHWPVGGDRLVREMSRRPPDPYTHKLYFDFGTETLDADYEPYQRKMDRELRRAGYVPGKNWITRKFVGAEHSERSWRERVRIPLSFLLA